MRNQQRIWADEHAKGTTLDRMANEHPASGVVLFTEWLKERGVTLAGRAVDVGAGKGRNSIFLAQLGYEVEALEYISLARECIEKRAKSAGVSEMVYVQDANIDEPWSYEDDTFDLAIDSFSSIDIETKSGREIYRNEMLRTLKPGGYALVTVCSAEDEWEAALIAKHPGPEPNSTIWPQNGKFQKDYTAVELREFYKAFAICQLRTIRKQTHKLGRGGIATNYWLVLRKSKNSKQPNDPSDT